MHLLIKEGFAYYVVSSRKKAQFLLKYLNSVIATLAHNNLFIT